MFTRLEALIFFFYCLKERGAMNVSSSSLTYYNVRYLTYRLFGGSRWQWRGASLFNDWLHSVLWTSCIFYLFPSYFLPATLYSRVLVLQVVQVFIFSSILINRKRTLFDGTFLLVKRHFQGRCVQCLYHVTISPICAGRREVEEEDASIGGGMVIE